ncbi:MAG: hypothetical protein NTZ47_01095 [Bacteroidetes bacterium]|nr:hypothetical protein [Bacteroidota bacterium]
MYINLSVCAAISFQITALNLDGLDEQSIRPNTENLLGWKSNYFRIYILQGRVHIQIDGTETCVPLSVPISKAE